MLHYSCFPVPLSLKIAFGKNKNKVCIQALISLTEVSASCDHF